MQIIIMRFFLALFFLLTVGEKELRNEEAAGIDVWSAFRDIVEIKEGDGYYLFLNQAGDLYSLGKGSWEDPDSAPKDLYEMQKIFEQVVSFSEGEGQLLILTEDHVLYGIGANERYQLATGDTDFVEKPIELGRSVRAAYAGDGFSLALSEEGDLYAFGTVDFDSSGLRPPRQFPVPTLLLSEQEEIDPELVPQAISEMLRREEEAELAQRMREIGQQASLGEEKIIAFTFDDGPSSHTPDLLEALKNYDAKASFFVLGSSVAKRKEILQRIVDEGHEVASHTYNHPQLTKLADEAVLQEIDSCDAIIYETIGMKPRLFRPPYGAYDNRVLSLLESRGKAVIMWSVDTLDWKYRDKQYVKNYILNHSKDGAIVLLHDVHRSSVDGFIEALPELRKRGYQLVTVSELLQWKGMETLAGKVYR